MKLFTLLENTACRPDLQAEHGLSLYLETEQTRVLFDAGQSGAFAENARKMNVDLDRVDFAVLSHGHYDHGGGLETFLHCNSHAPIYGACGIFGEHYNGMEKYIGLPQSLKTCSRIHLVKEPCSPAPHMELIPGIQMQCRYPIESFGLNVRENGVLVPDRFCHEQYLMVEEAGKKILFSGCSHRGILNIMEWFRPDVLVGGFHFKKLDVERDEQRLRRYAQALMEYPAHYCTCHCTGTAQYEFLKKIMGDRLEYLSAGTVTEL